MILSFSINLAFVKKIMRYAPMEAKSLDRIKMTENGLEFDQKVYTTTNLIFFNLTKIHDTNKH